MWRCASSGAARICSANAIRAESAYAPRPGPVPPELVDLGPAIPQAARSSSNALGGSRAGAAAARRPAPSRDPSSRRSTPTSAAGIDLPSAPRGSPPGRRRGRPGRARPSPCARRMRRDRSGRARAPGRAAARPRRTGGARVASLSQSARATGRARVERRRALEVHRRAVPAAEVCSPSASAASRSTLSGRSRRPGSSARSARAWSLEDAARSTTPSAR